MRRSPINLLIATSLGFAAVILLLSCTDRRPAGKKVVALTIDTAALKPDVSAIPRDTISCGDTGLKLVTNLYLLNGHAFSGIISARYSNGQPRYYLSVYQGMQHGFYTSFYPDGQPFEIRQYKNNLSSGRHYGYWNNGALKFDYIYVAEKREGDNRQWFSNGHPYIFAHYANDKEEGLQRGWRPNGKLFLNYVARDGHTYGLKETMLCYTLRDQKIRN